MHRRAEVRIRVRRMRARPARANNLPRARRHTRTPSDEPITAVYSAAGRNNAVDDRHSARRLCRLSRATDFGAAASRLPDNSGADVLSRCQPGCDDLVGDGAARAPIRPVPRLDQVASSGSFGSSIVTLQFVLDLNIDVAEQEVQAAINAASNLLPPDLPNPPIYSKINPADSPIMTVALTSASLPLSKVEDLAETTLSQKISQLPGVGMVSISGGQRPAGRVQANPRQLASYGLSLEDLRLALSQANVDQAKGNFDGPHQAFTIGANNQLLTSDGYR